MEHVTALANQKGGVGKSSSAYNLADALARAGQRVLVADTDPQGNLSRALAAEPIGPEQPTIADVLNITDAAGGATHKLADVIVPSVFAGVDLAPARIELSVAEANLLGYTGREYRLREALATVEGRYDHVLIDCPPSLGQLTVNGLTAATDVLVITEAEQWSADGMAELRRTIAGVQRYLSADLRYAGVIINRFRPSTKLHQAGAAEIEQYFREAPVWTPYVRLSVSVPESIAAGISLTQHGSSTATELAAVFDVYAANLIGS